MKRTILSILIALVLVLSFSLITAMPAGAATTYTVDDDWQVGSVPYAEDTDGDTDFATIQAAINAAGSGDTINVAAGTYHNDIVDGHWEGSTWVYDHRIDKSIILLGAQAGNDPAGSTDRGGETILTRSDDLPYSIVAPNVVIDGFMNGDSTANSGGRFIIGDAADGVTIKNCIIQNTPTTSSGHGVYIYPGAGNALIEYNTLSNTGWEAIRCDGEVEISNNTIKDIPSNKGIYLGVSSNAEISGNTISNTFYDGIQTYGLATITANDISGCYKGILIMDSAGGSIISGNTIYDTTYEGIETYGMVTITANDISGCYKGILIRDSAGGSIISGNTISNTTYEGIETYGLVTITANDISGGWHAILIRDSAGGSIISGNTISNTTYEGIQTFAPSTITGNDISGFWHGIQIRNHATGTVIDSNNIHDNTYHGIEIPNYGGSELDVTAASITNNTFTGNGSTGIKVGGGADGSGIAVHFNEFIGNGIFGVESVTTSSDVDAEYNWWGDVSGPSGVGPGTGDAVSTYVDYEPWIGQGGMVTGGGWIMSPVGAYTPDTSLSGKATFGFVSMYKKGAAVPTGKTQFNFQVADLNFHSDSYDWLVIAGEKAMYKGTGTINGTGNYGFMLSAVDSDTDKFRIKIWDKATDSIIYDNGSEGPDGTELAGGRIVIHKK